MIQVISLLGSLVILSAYVAGQRGWLNPHRRSYALANFVGAGVLAIVALVERQWGFLVLEGTWALVSAYSSIRPPSAPARSRTDQISDAGAPQH